MSNTPLSRVTLARRIDHTLLAPDATRAQVEKLCDECIEYGFYCACVNPVWVPFAAGRLADAETVVASVAGFPLGATTSEVKAYEALRAIDGGAREVDMVVNLGALAAGDLHAVRRDIEAVVDTVKHADPDALVKVILETRILSHEQIIAACRAVAEAQADFVKTSTGFHPAGGATVEHVRLMHKHAAPLHVKASGGIRDLPTALAMLEAGASRLGMSASVAVVRALEG